MEYSLNERIIQKRRPRKPREKIQADRANLDAQELAAIEATLEDADFPPQLIIEVTSACNLRCSMCAHSIITREPTIMADDLFNRIVEEIAAEAPDTRVWLSFYGEALLARDRLWGFIKRAKGVGLTNVTLNTNGTMLDDEKIHHLVHDGLDRIVFSIDGFSKEAYEKYRVGARHEDVYTHVPQLIAAARRNGNRPETIVQIVDLPDNHTELEDFRKFWNDLGAIVKVKELIGWTGAAVERDPQEELRITCPWVMTTFPITAIGEAVLCGTDYDANLPIGNVRQHSIRELWDRHRAYRRIHLEKRWQDLPDLCKGCTDWQVGGSQTFYPDGRQQRLRPRQADLISLDSA